MMSRLLFVAAMNTIFISGCALWTHEHEPVYPQWYFDMEETARQAADKKPSQVAAPYDWPEIDVEPTASWVPKSVTETEEWIYGRYPSIPNETLEPQTDNLGGNTANRVWSSPGAIE